MRTQGAVGCVHRAAKNLKRFSRKLETVPGGTTEKDKSVAMQFGSAPAGNKRKYHESRKTSFEWIIFAGLGAAGMLLGK